MRKEQRDQTLLGRLSRASTLSSACVYAVGKHNFPSGRSAAPQNRAWLWRRRADCGDLRFTTGHRNLEAVAPVLTVHRHHGAVVQVLNKASSHGAPGLAHEVPTLSEEVQSLPGSGDQPCFAARICIFKRPVGTGAPSQAQSLCHLFGRDWK